MAEGSTTLAYPVRLAVVGGYLSQLGAMLAVLSLPACGVAFYAGEYRVGIIYLLIAIGLIAVAWTCRHLPMSKTIQRNEGMVVVALTFVLTPALMAVPLAAGGLAPIDAFFEAVSAITTTGLTTLDSVETATSAFLFQRAWLQWCGGLGIAVLSVALLMGQHAAARRLANPVSDVNLVTTARTQARRILRVYVILTLGGTLALSLVVHDMFPALVTMLSTLSTGGFAPFDASIAALPASGAWIVTAFSFAGAVPLLLYHELLARRPGAMVADPELRTLVVAVFIVSAAVALSLWWNAGLDPARAIREGVMLGTSAQTTTGFAITDVGDLDPTSRMLLMFSMITGGGSGSTAGGVKLLRLLIILRLLHYFMQRVAAPPHAVLEPTLSGRIIERDEVEQAMLIVGVFLSAVAMSWLAFIAFGYAPFDSLFEVVSAIGTVGLSTGITSADLEAPLKLVLCIDMLLGRLEALALLVLLYRRTWFGRRAV